MSSEVKPITLTILDKDYVVGCPEDERESLFAAVEFLNGKLHEQRESGKVIGAERIAVMAALNIAHEYLQYKHGHESRNSDIGAKIEQMHRKISQVLSRDLQSDPLELSSAPTRN